MKPADYSCCTTNVSETPFKQTGGVAIFCVSKYKAQITFALQRKCELTDFCSPVWSVEGSSPGCLYCAGASQSCSCITEDDRKVKSSSLIFSSSAMSNALRPPTFLSLAFDPYWRRSFTTYTTHMHFTTKSKDSSVNAPVFTGGTLLQHQHPTKLISPFITKLTNWLTKSIKSFSPFQLMLKMMLCPIYTSHCSHVRFNLLEYTVRLLWNWTVYLQNWQLIADMSLIQYNTCIITIAVSFHSPLPCYVTHSPSVCIL